MGFLSNLFVPLMLCVLIFLFEQLHQVRQGELLRLRPVFGAAAEPAWNARACAGAWASTPPMPPPGRCGATAAAVVGTVTLVLAPAAFAVRSWTVRAAASASTPPSPSARRFGARRHDRARSGLRSTT